MIASLKQLLANADKLFYLTFFETTTLQHCSSSAFGASSGTSECFYVLLKIECFPIAVEPGGPPATLSLRRSQCVNEAAVVLIFLPSFSLLRRISNIAWQLAAFGRRRTEKIFHFTNILPFSRRTFLRSQPNKFLENDLQMARKIASSAQKYK